MKNKDKNSYKMGLTIGIIGFLAGIGLLFSDSKFVGIFGAIASAGLIIKGYQDMKTSQRQENDSE